MGDLVHRLEWDSEFFGFPIARINLQGIDSAGLVAIEAEARDEGILCAYGTLEPEAADTPALVQRHGHRLVEVGLTFTSESRAYVAPSSRSVVRRGTADDLPLLQDAIDIIGPWSRFGADARFGAEAARRMYGAWVERATRESETRMLSIAEDETGVTGFATHLRSTPDRMDLIGVTKAGTGASDAIMAFFESWARPGPVEAGAAAARNISVQRWLERCGYRASRCEYHFHRWFDEDPGVQP